LIDRGANINAPCYNGFSPLHRASFLGLLSICKILLDYGADVNITNIYGDTPINLATNEGHKNIVNLFIQHKKFLNKHHLLFLI
jgi:ankyrin repeat protein